MRVPEFSLWKTDDPDRLVFFRSYPCGPLQSHDELTVNDAATRVVRLKGPCNHPQTGIVITDYDPELEGGGWRTRVITQSDAHSIGMDGTGEVIVIGAGRFLHVFRSQFESPCHVLYDDYEGQHFDATASVTPDGRIVMAMSIGSVCFWSTSTGQCLGSVNIHGWATVSPCLHLVYCAFAVPARLDSQISP